MEVVPKVEDLRWPSVLIEVDSYAFGANEGSILLLFFFWTRESGHSKGTGICLVGGTCPGLRCASHSRFARWFSIFEPTVTYG